MYLNKEKAIKEFLIITLILSYAFFINWISGNMGVMPIDSFGFLDTGYNILNNNLPIRDFWIFTGFLVDYMEAIFLSIFGNNWNSHLVHASFMNLIATLSLYWFLGELGQKNFFKIFYCISFATLCYPVSGTPFAYIHSYIFSLIAMMFLIVAIKNKSKIIWFFFIILNEEIMAITPKINLKPFPEILCARIAPKKAPIKINKYNFLII